MSIATQCKTIKWKNLKWNWVGLKGKGANTYMHCCVVELINGDIRSYDVSLCFVCFYITLCF